MFADRRVVDIVIAQLLTEIIEHIHILELKPFGE